MTELRTRRRDHLRLLTARPDHVPGGAGPNEDHAAPRAERSKNPIRVVLAARHALVRAGYRALLETEGRIDVVGEADDRQGAIRLAAEREPDVVLLDMGLTGLTDPDAIAAAVSHPALTAVAVMLIGPVGADERVFGALRAGAMGVLACDAEPAELVGAVQLLAGGQSLLPARAMRRLLQEVAPHSSLDARVAARFEELTDREREIVALAAKGLSNSEIAARLVISAATAKTHVSRAMIKLHARHRAQLVAIAYEAGLVRASGDPRPGLAAAVAPATTSSPRIGIAGS